jgi:NAD(P)-dependent dehydrogenase (short-subunit alcohol dehydrogenase family)
MDKFKDRVAIVTGGSSGIGCALSVELGKRGAIVVAADINREEAMNVAAEIKQSGGRASATVLDVTESVNVQKLINSVVAEYGRIDYMFNNAGISIDGETRDMTIDHWRRIIDINQWGVIYGTMAAYKAMIAQGSGHIVNTASLAGLIPGWMQTAYATTKWAVVGLSVSLRAEAAALGVNISVVCPGLVQTNIFKETTLLNVSREDFIRQIPFKPMNVNKAANVILKGVEKNKGMMTFPFHARFFSWLYRHLPDLFIPLGRKGVKDFRALRNAE